MRRAPARRLSSLGVALVSLAMLASCQATALGVRPGALSTAEAPSVTTATATPSAPPAGALPSAPEPREEPAAEVSAAPAGVTAPSAQASASALPSGTTTVGLVTDFGSCTESERQIAAMVSAWSPAAIVSGGDNSQGRAHCQAFTQSVLDYYGGWVAGPQGPRFWPAIGNHDYSDTTAGLPNYLKTFSYLPRNADPQGRWYAKTIGRITFYFIDSNVTSTTLAEERLWLKAALRANAAGSDWQIVVMHHPPYTTGAHDLGTDERLDLRPGVGGFNYKEWGADLVIAGHQHIYEDVIRDGFHYVTAGVGAQELERPCRPTRIEGSRVCLEKAGAIRIVAAPTTLTLEYRQPTVAPGAGIASKVTDTIVLKK